MAIIVKNGIHIKCTISTTTVTNYYCFNLGNCKIFVK